MDRTPIRSAWSGPAIVAMVLALIVSTVAWTAVPQSALASPADQQATTGDLALQDGELTTVELVEQVNPAVVTVYNLTTLENQLGQEQTIPQGTGTGFIIDEEGHIVTNWHVVTGGEEYAVALSDGTTVPAELIGSDPRDDLAVVKIDPSDVPGVVPLGDSETLQPGQPVVAIGSPLGAFTNTITAGIVSGLDRDGFGGFSANCQNYADLIQHDAAINPGNSGGPLFNMQGEVIGVNTLGLPEGQGGVSLQGLFFAVPSNLVAEIAQQLIENGRIAAPYMGIGQRPIDPGTAAALELDVVGSIRVLNVSPGTPAEESGLLPNDIITAVDGQDISLEQGLAAMLLDYQPGDTVELTVLRASAAGQFEELTVELTFGNVPDEVLEACALQPQG
ncbi:MAG: trypsin-like peptidase domain-containing protein [Chloroflexota bacterium]|nr:trypsin-like peptidase domain-containing protein [Chloroflexota bacterium]